MGGDIITLEPFPTDGRMLILSDGTCLVFITDRVAYVLKEAFVQEFSMNFCNESIDIASVDGWREKFMTGFRTVTADIKVISSGEVTLHEDPKGATNLIGQFGMVHQRSIHQLLEEINRRLKIREKE